MRVSIVGLGIVGMALSQRLLRAGYGGAGWHQDPRRVHAFADMGGTPIAGDAELAAGDAVVYASGDRTALAGTTTHLRRFAQSVFDVGDFGNGSSLKHIAKLLVAVHNVVTAEALGPRNSPCT